MSEYPYHTISEYNPEDLTERVKVFLEQGYDILNGEVKLSLSGSLYSRDYRNWSSNPSLVYSVTMKISEPEKDDREIKLLHNGESKAFNRSQLREELLHFGITEERIDCLFNFIREERRKHSWTLEDFKKSYNLEELKK